MIAVAAADRSASVFRTSLIAPRANYSWCNLVAQAELINQFSILSSDGSKTQAGWGALEALSCHLRRHHLHQVTALPVVAQRLLRLSVIEGDDEHLQQLVL
ncbi:hypothetical protein [Sinorhizobium medicae]|uniref:hypothetical protein n=1 Tax=Sinorhizobium medicae TaxID=110321 RepID=UPI00041D222A|nr:hypothetical protein [Sinorhizobium medicae]TWA45905.1 hypothetical protein FB008_1269 [Sinorhizobium medicae]